LILLGRAIGIDQKMSFTSNIMIKRPLI